MAPTLVVSIERFASAIALLDERALETALAEPSNADPRWHSYAEYPREMMFVAYQRLCELAVRSVSQRVADYPQSLAQRILGQHQIAYRDLTGALVGIPDHALDHVPAEGEWSLRATMTHMLSAESGFRIAIEWALEQRGVLELTADQFDSRAALRRSRELYPLDGDLSSFLASFAEVHGRVLSAFSGLTDDDLELPMIWWDGIMPIRELLLGFNAHMREHVVQLDKIIHGIDLTVTEGARLARLIHHALGECEAASIGAPDTASPLQADIEAQFALWNSILSA